jgi:fumarate reductase subunit D
MGSRRVWSWLAFVVGLLLALGSLFADKLGVGRSPGFGRVQITALLVGVVLIALGFLAGTHRFP